MKKIILIAMLAAGCSNGSPTIGDPHEEWLICVNGQCDLYTGVEEIEVCKNTWDADFYDFTTKCVPVELD